MADLTIPHCIIAFYQTAVYCKSLNPSLFISFCRSVLDKEVVEQENGHVKELLSAAELQRAELELDLNKMRSEEIALRDALVKLQSLNEGLGMLISKMSKYLHGIERHGIE